MSALLDNAKIIKMIKMKILNKICKIKYFFIEKILNLKCKFILGFIIKLQ